MDSRPRWARMAEAGSVNCRAPQPDTGFVLVVSSWMACACEMFVRSGMPTTTLNCLYAKEDLLDASSRSFFDADERCQNSGSVVDIVVADDEQKDLMGSWTLLRSRPRRAALSQKL